MLQTFSIDGNGRQIDTKARFFRYEEGSAAGANEAIRVYADGNDLGTYLPGDAIKLPIDASRWIITPLSAALVATVRLGVGNVESARLVGNVNVIDRSIDQTIAGTEFFASAAIGAVVGNGGICTLLPNGSSKTIAVRSVYLQSAVAGSVILSYGSGGGSSSGVSGGQQLKSKLVNGTGSQSRISTASIAAANPSVGEVTGYTTVAAFYLPANDTRQIKFDTPLVLRGTNLIVVSANALNRDLSVVWDIREDE